MSHEHDKFKRSKRLLKDENAVAKQVKIVKHHSRFPSKHPSLREPHRLVKQHAMDCGNPKCFLCGNPRKTHKDRLTAQEKRLFQDLDGLKVTDNESN